MSAFDDDDDNEFSFGQSGQQSSKLSSLFKSADLAGTTTSNDSLKYKPPKQPTTVSSTSAPTSASQQQTATSNSAAHANNRYDTLGRQGLALIGTGNQYKLLIYVNKTAPTAQLKVNDDFKISLQKSNYLSFYDDNKQLWSLLFDNDDLIAQFATQILLIKFNQLYQLQSQSIDDSFSLAHDLKFNESSTSIEANDSIEIGTLIQLWSNMKINNESPIENTQQKPIRLKLGKNKLPKLLESLLIGMKQGDRRLFVFKGSIFGQIYPQINSNSIVFFDIHILRIKKNNEKVDNIDSNIGAPPMPPLLSGDNSDFNDSNESRSRADTFKDKSKQISDQMNDPKLDKMKLISRMAKMGQPMLPNMQSQQVDNDDLLLKQQILQQQQTNVAGNQYLPDSFLQANASSQMDQNVLAANLLIQQQQQQQLLQQQYQQQQYQQQQNHLALQNQILQGNQANSNQIALVKPQSQQLFYMPQQSSTPLLQQAQMSSILTNIPQQHTTQISSNESDVNKMIIKLDQINSKIDAINAQTQQNLPSMETNVILQNIQRIVRENEQHKRDLFEKSAKIEELNSKITDLLNKAQTSVEQKHQMIEEKNLKYQSNIESNIQRVYDLEKDKLKLTNELSELTSKLSEYNLEVNRIRSSEQQMKEKTLEMSRTLDTTKLNEERLLVENAELQTKLDKAANDLKSEKLARKQVEQRLTESKDEITELNNNLTTLQRQFDEKKRRFEQDKVDLDYQIEEMKRTHTSELKQLNDKLSIMRSNASESLNEQLKQIESDLNKDWQTRLDKQLEQSDVKFQRKLEQLTEEKDAIEKKSNEYKEQLKNFKEMFKSKEIEAEKLNERIEELTLFKEKYERLQQQALIMKEKFETRIKELIDEADSLTEKTQEVVSGQVKRLMNLIFKQLKQQINVNYSYQGNGILIAMLKLIKLFTVKVLDQQQNDEDKEIGEYEEEEDNFFAEFIYNAPEPQLENQKSIIKSISVEKVEPTSQQTQQQQPETTQAFAKISAPQPIVREKSNIDKESDEDEIEKINEEEVRKEIEQSIYQQEQEQLKQHEQQEQSENDKPDEEQFNQQQPNDVMTNSAKRSESNEGSSNDDDDAIQLINEENEDTVRQVLESKRLDELSKNNEVEEKEIINDENESNVEKTETEKTNNNELNESSPEMPNENHDKNNSSNIEKSSSEEPKKASNDDLNYKNEPLIESENKNYKDEENDEEDDDLFSDKLKLKPKPTNQLKKSLFDDLDDKDDDDDDANSLFKATPNAKSQKISTSQLLKSSPPPIQSSTDDSDLFDNPLSPLGDEKKQLSTSTTVTSSASNPNKSDSTNLKFSPPPLFDGDENEKEEEIDWFK